ncbi:MAG: helix-turn-helix transcriptional regulator [Chlorobi bacterium]|nr:helix-turn-helix transcriptional regulator [Chlorobiota bacterium]
MITKPHWSVVHEQAEYTAVFEAIGPDIVHARVVADHDTWLDYMDSELFGAICRELGIIGSATYVMINLNHIRKVSLTYKKDFANLVYNRGPIFTILVMYNVHPDILPVAEGVVALCPENSRVLIADDYRDAAEKIMAFKRFTEAGGMCPDEAPVCSAELTKANFHNSLARMCWIDMLELPVPLPSMASEFLPFFQAIEELRKDMLAKEEEHRKKISQIKQDGKQRLEENKILLNAKLDLHTKNAVRFEHDRATLNDIIAGKETELARISASAKEKADLLGKIYAQINNTIDIVPEQKNLLLGNCRKMIDTGSAEQQFRMELTEADSRFLDLLKKMHPSLSEKELRLSLLIKLNYDTKEIARTAGLTIRGIETTRYRLHKKLGLQKHQSMKYYFTSLCDS